MPFWRPRLTAETTQAQLTLFSRHNRVAFLGVAFRIPMDVNEHGIYNELLGLSTASLESEISASNARPIDPTSVEEAEIEDARALILWWRTLFDCNTVTPIFTDVPTLQYLLLDLHPEYSSCREEIYWAVDRKSGHPVISALSEEERRVLRQTQEMDFP